MVKHMYYLDLFSLYKPTLKRDRIAARKFLSPYRDIDMARQIKKQKGMCFWCPNDITMADHLDHLIPVYYGGKSSRTNLVAACKACNLTKSTQQIEITNQYTIDNYNSIIRKYKKWQSKVKAKPHLMRYRSKEQELYFRYHANLFRHIR